MTSFFSPVFICAFLPCVILAYALCTRKMRWLVLLTASYMFFWAVSKALIVFILLSTVIVYVSARLLNAIDEKKNTSGALDDSAKARIKRSIKRQKKAVLCVAVLLNLLTLFALKYLGFFSASLVSLLGLAGVTVAPVSLSLGVPIGISFYTLMALSYLTDVYRGSVSADKNLGRVALFLSFFPQIMEGPICRYGQTAQAAYSGEPLNKTRLYEGLLRIAFGFAKKMIVADRLNIFVQTVFDNNADYDGGVIALAAIAYTVQLYCDFSGTMDIAIGIARIFNVSLPENFRQPFFSRTASEFWQRWHITLGTWFKDYIYYPISLSKPCKAMTKMARKKIGLRYGPLLVSSIALFAVWFCNGLWHGAGTQYLLFGMYYFVLIVCGGFLEPLMQTFCSKTGFNRSSRAYTIFQVLRTIIIIFIGELIFRSSDAQTAITMISKILFDFSFETIVQGDIFTLGIDTKDCAIVGLVLLVLLIVGFIKERGGNPCLRIAQCNVVVRWAALILLFLAIVVFGAYGAGYVPVDPMYAQF